MLKLAAYHMQQTRDASSYKLCYYLLLLQKCSVTRQKVRKSLKIPSHYTMSGNRFISRTFGKKLTQIEQLLSRTTFGECLCFGSAIKTVSIWFTKQINTFKSSQSYFVKQLFRKKSWNITQKMLMMESRYNKVSCKIKLSEQCFDIFL